VTLLLVSPPSPAETALPLSPSRFHPPLLPRVGARRDRCAARIEEVGELCYASTSESATPTLVFNPCQRGIARRSSTTVVDRASSWTGVPTALLPVIYSSCCSLLNTLPVERFTWGSWGDGSPNLGLRRVAATGEERPYRTLTWDCSYF
jgi:hypothetical protein